MCGRDQKCGDKCESNCEGPMCPTVMYYCQADYTCDMMVPECEDKPDYGSDMWGSDKYDSDESEGSDKPDYGSDMWEGKYFLNNFSSLSVDLQ